METYHIILVWWPTEIMPHTVFKIDHMKRMVWLEYEKYNNKCVYSADLLSKLEVISKEDNVKLNMKLIEKAITFVRKWHGTQMRKTGDHPFYFHPLAVAGMVAEHYPKSDIIIAAILHDVVEDSECTVETVEKEFNQRIADMVERLTKIRCKCFL